MSTEDNLAEAAMATVAEKCCASCGVAEIDDVKLKLCPNCDRALYCSDECQQEHLQKHEAICKERAAGLYDEILFKQPESDHLGDCPICFLPMPHIGGKCIQNCCGKKICRGCAYANRMRVINERQKEHRCPFCRHLEPQTLEESEKLCIERAELNDPIALQELGAVNYQRGDYGEAFRHYTKAAALGDVESMSRLAGMYHSGLGVEKDSDKEKALLEKAAIVGHPRARYNLGCLEAENGRIDRAVLHWIIAANLGEELSIKALKEFYKAGCVSKDDFAAALRAYQDATAEIKSPQRDAAEANLQKDTKLIELLKELLVFTN